MDVVDLNAGFGERHDHRRHPPEGRAQRRDSADRPVRLRQVDAPALPQRDAPHGQGRVRHREILLDGVDINAPGVDPVLVRRRVGMVFQRPNPFPTMSIYDNVAAGLRLHGRQPPRAPPLRRGGRARAAPGRPLGRGQGPPAQHGRRALGRPAAAAVHRARACRGARDPAHGRAVLGSRPDLDRRRSRRPSTHSRSDYTIVIVTHNMQQAARVSDTTAFMTILEAGSPARSWRRGPPARSSSKPINQVTGAYVSGQFG